MVKKVLMVTDGSEDAAKGVAFGAEIFEGSEVKITLLTVMEEPIFPTFSSDGMIASGIMVTLPLDLEKELQKAGEEVIRRAGEVLEKKGITYEGKITFGQAANEIVNEAREGAYELVVIGSRGHKALAEFLLGSVSNRVAHHAPCSVLIVR